MRGLIAHFNYSVSHSSSRIAITRLPSCGTIHTFTFFYSGAVAADGNIEPGDMLLQVNDVNFENMSNDDAVHVLREIVHKPG